MKKSIIYFSLLLSARGFSQASVAQLSVKDKAQSLVKQHMSVSQAAPVSLLDSTYYSSWNSATSQWSSPARVIYGYNVAGKQNSLVNANLVSGSWKDNNRQTNYTFDANANLTGYESQYWNISSWENIQKTTYTYDNANNQLTELVQNWDISTSSWLNNGYTINTYDADHNRLTSINQSWEPNTSTWQNQMKEMATYATNHQYTGLSFQSWDSNTATWENSDRYINFVYTNGDLVSLEGEMYDTNTFAYMASYKVTNTYDGNHHLMNATSQEFDFTSMAWVNSDKEDYTYDANGNQITYLSQSWNSTTNAWENGFRQFDYYSFKSVGINSLSKQEMGISLYPNPAKEKLSISSAVDITELRVIDLTGKTLMTQVPADGNSIKLDVSTLPQGVYVIELKGENAIMYKKMIRE